MAKGVREKIKLVSSAGTGHFYTTTMQVGQGAIKK